MTHLKEGDKAPGFKSVDQHDKPIELSQFKGSKVILYFYPKDDTPGCTKEACNLRDNFDALKKLGFVILGVSKDPVQKHQKFISKYDLPFDLIADTDLTVCNAYGVYGEKKFMGKTHMGINRTTFVIDEKGKIEKIFTKVNTANHTEQILEALELTS